MSKLSQVDKFMDACIEQNSLQELYEAQKNGPDHSDCKEWGLDEEQWGLAIKLAIEELEARCK